MKKKLSKGKLALLCTIVIFWIIPTAFAIGIHGNPADWLFHPVSALSLYVSVINLTVLVACIFVSFVFTVIYIVDNW